jgi:glycosyltransferase involved in cell wall biosynthesis/SAM-dependent methyltransferase
MRVAFFSPMPPSKSGIADYSAALAAPLGRLVDLDVFTERPAGFAPARYDALVYQVGNNGWHAFAYEMALEHPGVVVLHEANLHHLIADITIRRNDWDAYLRECEYAGGPEALAYAKRVRALEAGPDYEGLPMLRRLLERSRAVIVHSAHMVEQVRAAGFAGPVARILHGAWIPEADRWRWRERLGLDESSPVAGVFGFLKPYKRIAESLRAFRRLVRIEARARLILVGEPHPEFPIESRVSALGLSAHVRTLGFTPIEDFTGAMAACDAVLNLRYPTVGESSGSLLRAFGLGKPVLVSDVGAFRELPDEICLKVPVDETEEDVIFEYLDLLFSRPEIGREVGRRARDWVERECTWELAAARYASFLRAVAEDREWIDVPGPCPKPPRNAVEGAAEYILGWAKEPEARGYVGTHISRLQKTIEITPPGGPADKVLEMGAYFQITPALRSRLGYGEVRACYYGPAGTVERRTAVSAEGEAFECQVELFDGEKDPFPYADGYFRTVLCCELIEHLFTDPMHLLAEVNRILAPEGHLVLTTPNVASLRAIAAILQGYHPGFFPQYLKPGADGSVDARHNREYTPKEVAMLLGDAGFDVALLETGPFRAEPRPELAWVSHLLERYWLSTDLRDEGIYAVGRKTGPVRNRYPAWLYSGGA